MLFGAPESKKVLPANLAPIAEARSEKRRAQSKRKGEPAPQHPAIHSYRNDGTDGANFHSSSGYPPPMIE